MVTGNGFWRRQRPDKRFEVLRDLGHAINTQQGVHLFASIIDKTNTLHGDAAVQRATEELIIAFDRFLMRLHRQGDTQRGLMVFADSQYKKRHRGWIQQFREIGTRAGALRNIADVPYFAETREARLLQAADLVSHAVYRLYERRDNRLFQMFGNKFDEDGGIPFGIRHCTDTRDVCDCPRCYRHRDRQGTSPWVMAAAPATQAPQANVAAVEVIAEEVRIEIVGARVDEPPPTREN